MLMSHGLWRPHDVSRNVSAGLAGPIRAQLHFARDRWKPADLAVRLLRAQSAFSSLCWSGCGAPSAGARSLRSAPSRKLKAEGVEALGIVATAPENARLYFKFRPTRLRLAADPALTTHRAYGLPKPEPTPEFLQGMQTTRINPFGDFPEPLPIAQAVEVVAKADGYSENDTDRVDMERQWPQLKGQFLIDRDGYRALGSHRMRHRGPSWDGKTSSVEEIIAAARGLQ